MLICYLLPKSNLYYTIYSLFTLVVLAVFTVEKVHYICSQG